MNFSFKSFICSIGLIGVMLFTGSWYLPGYSFSLSDGESRVSVGDTITVQGDGYIIKKCTGYLGGFQYYYGDSVYKDPNPRIVSDSTYFSLFFLTITPKNLTDSTSMVFDSISFAVGVDSAQTMKGVFEGDLDPAKGMFWTWQSGYINWKLEVEDLKGNELQFHIGGFSGKNNTYREMGYKLPKGKNLSGLVFDVKAFLLFAKSKGYTMVMSPGSKAVDIADNYKRFFSLRTW